ncbi:MAG: LysR family transcriptional regulator [Thermoplasmata archaeon]|nr:LysR family transcriptional regulator [Thermoplasmata archaeon]
MLRLDDLRIFARIAETGSLTAAAKSLDLPKQTVSRRLYELERALGAELVHRTTRRLRLTDIGVDLATRCEQIVRLSDEASLAVSAAQLAPRGTLRITADVLFGERFIVPLVNEFLSTNPEMKIEFTVTRAFPDLVREGFDLAFWVGHPGAKSLVSVPLGSAQIRYCASPEYVERRGRPMTPRDLRDHDCIELVMEEAGRGWPFRSKRGIEWIRIGGRIRTNSFEAMRQAALSGLGVALFPAFVAAEDVRVGRLVSVLDDHVPDVGTVEMVSPKGRFSLPKVRCFADLVRARLGRAPPWVVP